MLFFLFSEGDGNFTNNEDFFSFFVFLFYGVCERSPGGIFVKIY